MTAPDTPPPAEPTPPVPQYVYVQQPARRTDPFCVIALIMGVLSVFGGWCCFGFPGFMAIIAGVMGIHATKDGSENGHGMAIAGIVLGVLTGVPWLIVGIATGGGMLTGE